MKNKFVKFLYSGSPQVVIVKNVVLAVIIYLLYRIVKNALDKTTEESIEQLQNQTIQMVENGNVPTNDGSIQAPNTDQAQANEIALQQYTIMNQFFIDEFALIEMLCGLNGSQLQLVYTTYGVKDGKNLFQWYNDKLNSSIYTGQSLSAPCLEQCTSFFSDCSELDAMREMWQKSGLTF